MKIEKDNITLWPTIRNFCVPIIIYYLYYYIVNWI